ncbi:hypothetical protein FR551_09275 [Campylobacter coli]|nr:hypothetical protein [Campylobacter coli]ECL3469919.1 hypothetical protein [Campylobacter coli]ECQ1290749.1 hypothetical protein [Campylobacter coli]ECQ6886568.1 hypothetical protein [Campylobacter coli]ECQ8670338.1 hypothetical protein [Campylobacter coli]
MFFKKRKIKMKKNIFYQNLTPIYLFTCYSDIEVIGNIHENEELLKQ